MELKDLTAKNIEINKNSLTDYFEDLSSHKKYVETNEETKERLINVSKQKSKSNATIETINSKIHIKIGF